jgi:hypothetical protein
MDKMATARRKEKKKPTAKAVAEPPNILLLAVARFLFSIFPHNVQYSGGPWNA